MQGQHRSRTQSENTGNRWAGKLDLGPSRSLLASNSVWPLKTLKGLTLFEYICRMWTIEPDRSKLNPTHQMPGLNTYEKHGGVLEQAKTVWKCEFSGSAHMEIKNEAD